MHLEHNQYHFKENDTSLTEYLSCSKQSQSKVQRIEVMKKKKTFNIIMFIFNFAQV